MNRLFHYVIPLILSGLSHAIGGESKGQLYHPASSADTNAVSLSVQSPDSSFAYGQNSIYLQFNTSGLYPSLTDWKNQLHLSDGSHPSGTNIVFGAEAGYGINEYIQIGIGYEYFFTTKVATVEATGDQINSTFLYGSLRGGISIASDYDLLLYGCIDAGSLAVTEVMENYYGQDFSKTGSTTAYRLMIGVQHYMTNEWSIMAGAGYVRGRVNDVTVNGRPWPNFSLDLSGLVLRFAVNYHIHV
jgi:hypothetical protein